MRRTLAVTAFMIVVASPAGSQQSAGGHFAVLRETLAYRQAAIAGAYETTAWQVAKCEGSGTAIGTRVAVVSMPVVVDERLRPQSGGWIEHVTATGCGRAWVLNVLMIVRAPGRLSTAALLPGSTNADPLLQKDAALYAFAAAGIDPKGCKPAYIADTKFLEFSRGPAMIPGKPAWSEQWTVTQCETRTPVTMRFGARCDGHFDHSASRSPADLSHEPARRRLLFTVAARVIVRWRRPSISWPPHIPPEQSGAISKPSGRAARRIRENCASRPCLGAGSAKSLVPSSTPRSRGRRQIHY